MPGRNGTGPAGMGTMTGRAMGPCAGSEKKNDINYNQGRGFGLRQGRGCGFGGRGRRNMVNGMGLPGWMRFSVFDPWMEIDPVTEKNILKNQADVLRSHLDAVNQRIGVLENDK